MDMHVQEDGHGAEQLNCGNREYDGNRKYHGNREYDGNRRDNGNRRYDGRNRSERPLRGALVWMTAL